MPSTVFYIIMPLHSLFVFAWQKVDAEGLFLSAWLTDKPDNIKGGVGEDGSIGFIQVVVWLLLASDGLSRHTGANVKVVVRQKVEQSYEKRRESVIIINTAFLDNDRLRFKTSAQVRVM